LAMRLGVSVDEIKNAKKRFRRAWERVVSVMDESQAKEARHG